MKKKINWPSQKEIERVLKKLEKVPGTRGLHPNAPMVDVIKHDICREIVGYLLEHELKQYELAEKLNIANSDMSEILHYRVDSYTIDRLVKLLEILHKKVSIKIA